MEFFFDKTKCFQGDRLLPKDEVAEVDAEEQQCGNGESVEVPKAEGRDPERGDKRQCCAHEDLKVADVFQHGPYDAPENCHLINQDGELCDQGTDGGAAGSVFRDQ